jgi:oxygen-independent coproporphyrinogen-3 oxidase
MEINSALLNKYNIQVPRYTSYPTVPVWKEGIDMDRWKDSLRSQFNKFNKEAGISLYLHLPFCESMCTFCGCNKKITTNHSVEEEYLTVILKEWSLYRALMDEAPVIREIHLGGGTPTYFSPENLKRLINTILESSIIHPENEFGFEGHPNNTTKEHLETLYSLGFRRVSFGVQDNNIEVQTVINRIQPFERVQHTTETAREIGYKSVNFDLIYGLPLQNRDRMEKTILENIALRPDRVAFYSYAHVPWTSRGQRLFDENDLPTNEEKIELYRLGKQLFTESGYYDIGMDHFALPEDDLYIAWKEGWLHRNFMGYTTQRTAILLGLGVSSISDTGNAFAQNDKILLDYYKAINNNELAVNKGFFLSEEDIDFKKYILDIACQGKTKFNPNHLPLLEEFTFPELKKLEEDNFVTWDKESLEVTPLGRHFIRNVCRAFDLHLLRNIDNGEKPIFSRAI